MKSGRPTERGLFDVAAGRKGEFYELIETVSDGAVQTEEIESRDEIVNHRMTFLFMSDQMAAELDEETNQKSAEEEP